MSQKKLNRRSNVPDERTDILEQQREAQEESDEQDRELLEVLWGDFCAEGLDDSSDW